MANKKKQHFIPQCYLKGFISKQIPSEHKNNKFFTNGVWVLNLKKHDLNWEMKHPKNIFYQSYYYNLSNDEPDTPKIENILSKIESKYPHLLSKISKFKSLTFEEYIILSFFVQSFEIRVEKQQEHWFSQIKSFETMYRNVEKTYTGAEKAADQLFNNVSDIPKNLILNTDMIYILMAQGINFIINETEEPFITSDAPVVHNFQHIDNLLNILSNSDLLDMNIKPNRRERCTFLPLSPKVFLIASIFLKKNYQNKPYIICTDKRTIFQLNLQTLLYSNESIITSEITQMNELNNIKALLSAINEHRVPNKDTYLIIYTNQNRYHLPLIYLQNDDSKLEFKTSDIKKLEKVYKDNVIEEIQIFQDGFQSCVMREIKFKKVDLSGKTPSIIVDKFGLYKIYEKNKTNA